MNLKKSVSKEIGLVALKFLLNILEVVCRVIYLCMPLWVFLLFMNLRKKMNTIDVIQVYTSKNAEFQHVYPGVLLVLEDPQALEKKVKEIAVRTESFLGEHKYTIIAELLFLILLVLAF